MFRQAAEALRSAVTPAGSACRVRPVAERYRVSVIRPRQGRDRGEWVLRVRGPGIPRHGRREQTGLACQPATRAQAQRMAEARARELGGEGLCVLEVVDLWLEEAHADASAETLRSRRTMRGHLEESALGGLSVDLLSPPRVQAWRDFMAERMATTSAATHERHLSAAWGWASVRGLVYVPWPRMPPWRHRKTCKRAYTEEELLDLLAWAQDYLGGRYLPILAWLAATGLRVGESVQLRRENLRELPGGVVEAVIRQETRKGRPGRKIARVSADLGALLLAGEGPWVFARPGDPSEHLSAGRVGVTVRAWAKARGVFGELDVHGLRRAAAGRLMAGGASVELARRVTGHRSPKVFLDYAAKADLGTSGVERLLWPAVDAALGPAGPTTDPRDSIVENDGETVSKCKAPSFRGKPPIPKGMDSSGASGASGAQRMDLVGPTTRNTAALAWPAGFGAWVAGVLRRALGSMEQA